MQAQTATGKAYNSQLKIRNANTAPKKNRDRRALSMFRVAPKTTNLADGRGGVLQAHANSISSNG